MKFAPIHRRTLEKAAKQLGGQDALAEYLGVSAELVHAWMRGDRGLPSQVFTALVDLLVGCARTDRATASDAKELR